ncbi:MAG: hypothetical protein Fur0032_13240 [Terrimicrobiaceae bacterium]
METTTELVGTLDAAVFVEDPIKEASEWSPDATPRTGSGGIKEALSLGLKNRPVERQTPMPRITTAERMATFMLSLGK